MKNEIKINDEISMDLPKLIVSKLLAVANSGGGKSWLIRRIVEQAYGKVQILIIDPEGEFSTLREKFDFVLCGKGMDAPAEPRSAALLARKLLEGKTSAIIDLYELHPQERKRFVRLFLESMVNAPKELYNDCLVILDEAHKFAPEKEESESTSSVIEMASLGRKRGFCLIPVTQRVSKLSKDVAAECNNKLMGRASLDLDRKRTADELGITNKEEILALRNLQPGEFFAFGPAISNEVIKLKVGDVQTSIPKAGRQTKVAPPSEKVKRELAALANLPQEAEQEARTIADLKAQNSTLKRQLSQKIVEKGVKHPETGPMGVSQWKSIGMKYGYWDFFAKQIEGLAKIRSEKIIKQYIAFIHKMLHITKERAGKIISAMDELQKQMPNEKVETPKIGDKIRGLKADMIIIDEVGEVPKPRFERKYDTREIVEPADSVMGKGERAILVACAQHDGCTREQLTVLTQYKRSSRDAFISRLQARGFVRAALGKINPTDEGMAALGDDFERLPTGIELQEHLMKTLPEGERKILEILIREYPNAVERENLSEETNYQRSSRDAFLQRLSARQLVVREGSAMKASETLF